MGGKTRYVWVSDGKSLLAQAALSLRCLWRARNEILVMIVCVDKGFDLWRARNEILVWSFQDPVKLIAIASLYLKSKTSRLKSEEHRFCALVALLYFGLV